jgi:two-component system chemotaxis response regulator CheY
MKKILIVDDSTTLRQQLKADLEGAGYKVVEAEDGALGLAALKSNSDVDLILCDVNMPNMDGLTMCDKVRKEAAFATKPIFMLTTESTPEMKVKGKVLGVKVWIVKPYEKASLLGVIDKVIGR